MAGGAVLPQRPPPQVDGDIGNQSVLMVTATLPADEKHSQGGEAGEQGGHCQQTVDPKGLISRRSLHFSGYFSYEGYLPPWLFFSAFSRTVPQVIHFDKDRMNPVECKWIAVMLLNLP
jgi:hypothetical protein